MEGEHTPTIIQLIRSTDLAVIQFKDSHIFFIFPTRKNSWGDIMRLCVHLNLSCCGLQAPDLINAP